jgi:hypothetical protein
MLESVLDAVKAIRKSAGSRAAIPPTTPVRATPASSKACGEVTAKIVGITGCTRCLGC